MSLSAFSDAVGAFKATLERAPAVCEPIYRARERVVPDGTDKAVNIQFEGATPNRSVIKGGPVDWSARISVECLARSVTEAGDLAVDPLLVAVYERLAADSTLGGIVDDIGEPTIEAECSVEGKKTGWVKLTYLVEIRTEQASLR